MEIKTSARKPIFKTPTIIVLIIAMLSVPIIWGFKTSPYISLDGGVATQASSSSGFSTSISYTALDYTTLSWDGYIFERYVMRNNNIVRSSLYSINDPSGLSEMQQAKANAAAVSLALVKGSSAAKVIGLEIVGVAKANSFTYGLDVHGLAVPLTPGLIISSVNGVPISTLSSFYQLLSKEGQTFRLKVEGLPKGGSLVLNVPSSEVYSKDGLGLVLSPVWKAKSQVPTVDTGTDQGPSAGLMFTLADIETLSHKSLSRIKIAGTGTVDGAGVVGEVGAIPFKVNGAISNGDKVFFVPASQWRIAHKVARGRIIIVSVSTVSDALAWLCDAHRNKEACSLTTVASKRIA